MKSASERKMLGWITRDQYKRRWDNSERKWIFRHIEIVESKLGRKLDKHEVAHHVDGNILNNSIGNIEVISRSQHMALHRRKYYICTIKGCSSPHHGKGYCQKHYRSMCRFR